MASPGLGQFQPLKLASPLSHIIWKGFRVCYVHKVWAGGHENVKHFCRLKREEIKSTEFKLQLPSDLAETIFWKDKSMQRFLNLVFEQNVLEASVVEKMSLKIAKGKKKKSTWRPESMRQNILWCDENKTEVFSCHTKHSVWQESPHHSSSTIITVKWSGSLMQWEEIGSKWSWKGRFWGTAWFSTWDLSLQDLNVDAKQHHKAVWGQPKIMTLLPFEICDI